MVGVAGQDRLLGTATVGVVDDPAHGPLELGGGVHVGQVVVETGTADTGRAGSPVEEAGGLTPGERAAFLGEGGHTVGRVATPGLEHGVTAGDAAVGVEAAVGPVVVALDDVLAPCPNHRGVGRRGDVGERVRRGAVVAVGVVRVDLRRPGRREVDLLDEEGAPRPVDVPDGAGRAGPAVEGHPVASALVGEERRPTGAVGELGRAVPRSLGRLLDAGPERGAAAGEAGGVVHGLEPVAGVEEAVVRAPVGGVGHRRVLDEGPLPRLVVGEQAGRVPDQFLVEVQALAPQRDPQPAAVAVVLPVEVAAPVGVLEDVGVDGAPEGPLAHDGSPSSVPEGAEGRVGPGPPDALPPGLPFGGRVEEGVALTVPVDRRGPGPTRRHPGRQVREGVDQTAPFPQVGGLENGHVQEAAPRPGAVRAVGVVPVADPDDVGVRGVGGVGGGAPGRGVRGRAGRRHHDTETRGDEDQGQPGPSQAHGFPA